MHRVHYAGHSIVTGTAIAHALLDYAQALAEAGGSATVVIPTWHEDGSRGESEVLIGPSSQLISDAEESEFPELIDDHVVAYLGEAAANARKFGVSSTTAEIPARPEPREWTDFEF